MTYNEYQRYVEYACNRIPRFLICNYFDWRNRATLARFLVRVGELVPAAELFKSIYSVKIDYDNIDYEICSDIENKIWCMEELGQIVWVLKRNVNEALNYTDEAIRRAAMYPYKFDFVVRGELLSERWSILWESDQCGLAKKEAIEQINRSLPVPSKSNSVIFHSFIFLAETEKKDNMQQALRFLRNALRYFPHEYDDINQLNSVWKEHIHDPETTYLRLKGMTEHDVVWDDDGQEPPQ